MRFVCPKLLLCAAIVARAAGAQEARPPPSEAPPVPVESRGASSDAEPTPATEAAGSSAAPTPSGEAAAVEGPPPAGGDAVPAPAGDLDAPPEAEEPRARPGITGICGAVVEAKTREPLIEAQVRVVKGGAKTVRTDVDGRYALPLPPGEYDVRAFYELHRPRRVAGITVRQGECTVVDLPLAADTSAVEEVIVEARADARREAAVLAERKKAVPVSDAVSAQEISRTPDSSAADAVKRVVSATVVDGKRVFLRGLGGRYSAVLLNGVPLPSPDADEHNVPLDLFPTALLANLTVVKTYTPDLPGGFSGGALQIGTTPYPTSFEAKLKLTGAGDSVATLRDVPTYRGGSFDFLGFDDGGRSLPGSVPTSKRVLLGELSPEEMERVGESFDNNWARRTTTSYPNLGVTATIGDTRVIANRTAGYVATLGYGVKQFARAGEVGKVSRGAVLQQTELLASAQAGTSADLSALVNAGIDLARGHQLSALALYTHTGESRAATAYGYSEDAQLIDTSRFQFTSRGLLFGQVSGRHGLPVEPLELEWQANASLTTKDEPDTRDVVHNVFADGPQFKPGPGSGTRFFSQLSDVAGGAGVHLTRPWGDSRLRGGATVQASSRRFEARRFRFNVISADSNVYRLPMEEMLDATHIGKDFLLIEETLQGDAYDAELTVYAGYLVADWAASSRLRVAAGVRYEGARQILTPGSKYATEDTIPPEGTDRTDGDVLPAVNATFAVRPDMNLRGGYSFTLARPQFRELAPFIYFDFSRRRSVTGNPDLETTRIHNVDARWEWFFREEEVLAASAFYKRFDEPIETVVKTAAQGDLFYDNAPEAAVVGLELEARVALGRFAAALRPFRAAANVSLIHSEVNLGEKREHATNARRPLQGQSPFVVNAALTWAAPLGIELTALYNVFGRRIAEVGWDGLPDTYEQPFHRVDLALSRNLATSWKLKAAFTNLLDEEVVLKQDEFVVLRYRPGLAGSMALEWSR